MFNKDLFDKICNVNCSFEELEQFVVEMHKKEFDLDNPFEKYYSVDRVISAIEKYQSKQVGAKYLAYWMSAYDWIIMGGFKIGYAENGISLKEFVIWEIADWLDGLSFFEDSDDWFDLEKYKTVFKVLSRVFEDIDDCEAVFAQTGSDGEEYDEEDDDDDCVVVLAVNNVQKYYIKIYGQLNFTDIKTNFSQIDFAELNRKAENLQKNGHTELKYYTFNHQ